MRKEKRCIIRIQNATDSACFVRAVVVGQCHSKGTNTPQWRREWAAIRRSDKPLQKRLAVQLLGKKSVSQLIDPAVLRNINLFRTYCNQNMLSKATARLPKKDSFSIRHHSRVILKQYMCITISNITTMSVQFVR